MITILPDVYYVTTLKTCPTCVLSSVCHVSIDSLFNGLLKRHKVVADQQLPSAYKLRHAAVKRCNFVEYLCVFKELSYTERGGRL